MVVCYFCKREDTTSYWNYYCEDCTRIKAFCKLVGPDKLVNTLQFNIHKENVDELLNNNLKKALNDLGGKIVKVKRTSSRLKQKYDANDSLKIETEID